MHLSAPFAVPRLHTVRVDSLDLLRGMAVLGMMVMNIQSFSMIRAAYINPTAFGDLAGLNKWVWIGSHVMADQKFLSIFSILFGAGIILFTERLEVKNLAVRKIFFRKLILLLMAGLIHSYFIWYGDILVCYALCAFLIYWIRNWKPGGLLTLGLVLLAVPAFNYWLFGESLKQWPEEALTGIAAAWKPGTTAVAAELEAMRGGYFAQVSERASAAFEFQTYIFLIWYGWRVAGFMLIGMSLFKLGILSAKKHYSFYILLVFTGLMIGLPMTVWGVKKNFDAGWDYRYSMFLGWEWNYIGSIFIALGYVAIVQILEKLPFLGRMKQLLRAVGRMAFSNYILMSILCTFIFYGYGLGMFGRYGSY